MVRRDEKNWRPMSVHPYGNEDELQRLLYETPSLLPGISSRGIAARGIEVPGVGFVDLVVIDVDGSIALVECKLRSNSQIRREVVGQILAYASGLWRMPYLDFEARFTRATIACGRLWPGVRRTGAVPCRAPGPEAPLVPRAPFSLVLLHAKPRPTRQVDYPTWRAGSRRRTTTPAESTRTWI
jgi:hypothetical protein